ncbi:MAG TPA: hypothetical protein PKE12_07115 [Kiritimatiellia bacterium]|nr:hypothetical protein [Kiritimatiellia bacterium]
MKIRLCVWALVCAAALRPAEGQSISAGLLYQDNITRADRSADELDETFLRIDAAKTWSKALDRDWRWDAQVRGAGEAGFEYTDLNQVSVGGDVGLTYKAGLGRQAPHWRAGVAADYAWFDESDRSRSLLSPELRLTQRLNATVVGELYVRHERAEAEAELFDSRANVAGLLLRWAAGRTWSLVGGYQYRDGDVVSYAGGMRDDIDAVADVSAPMIEAFDRTLYAYRLEAKTHVAQFGGAVALGKRWTLDALYEWQQTEEYPISYEVQIFQVALRVAL